LISGAYSCEGEIVFEDEKITNQKPYQICQKGISRTFQVPLIFPSLTVYENVETGIRFGNSKNVINKNKAISEILEFTGLIGRENIKAKHLKLFDKKKAMLATILSTNPKLLLLDEPAGGLNPAEIQESINLFERINQEKGITIMIIEHLMKVLMSICDRLMIIHLGGKVCIAPPNIVAKDKKVIEIYLGAEYVGN
jgi:branched-chain amino acid transport system ATP-binding protein